MEEFNDDLHRLILHRLGERKEKLDKIEEWKKQKKMFPIFIGYAIAACIIGIIIFIPWNKELTPNMDGENVRSGIIDIDAMIKDKNYTNAMKIINSEMEKSDSILKVLDTKTNKDDEEIQYEIQVEKLKIEELKEKRELIERKCK